MLPQRLLKIQGLRLAKNAFLAFQRLCKVVREALNRRFPTFDSCNVKLLRLISLLVAVVRQQFVMGINCSIFLYRNSLGVNQRLALTRKSFRIAQVSHCAVQRV